MGQDFSATSEPPTNKDQSDANVHLIVKHELCKLVAGHGAC